MAFQTLSQLEDWELVHDQQDIRGQTLLDEQGGPVGRIDDMLVDTDLERVVAIRLDNGREIPARDFVLREGRPVLLTAPAAGAARTVPLREEELLVRKRAVPAGAVQIEKEVVTEQRTMDVPVTREEAVIERHPVDRRPADAPIGEGETIEVPLREEEVTVEKHPVVYEEVGVDKRAVQETRPVSGTVRREVAEVDTEGEVDVKEGRGR